MKKNPLLDFKDTFPSSDPSVMACAQWFVTVTSKWTKKDFDALLPFHLAEIILGEEEATKIKPKNDQDDQLQKKSKIKQIFDDYEDEDFYSDKDYLNSIKKAPLPKKSPPNIEEILDILSQNQKNKPGLRVDDEIIRAIKDISSSYDNKMAWDKPSSKLSNVIQTTYNIAINQNLNSPLTNWCLAQSAATTLSPAWEILCSLAVNQSASNDVLFRHIEKTSLSDQTQFFERLCKQALTFQRPDWISHAWCMLRNYPIKKQKAEQHLANVFGSVIDLSSPEHDALASRLFEVHHYNGQTITPNAPLTENLAKKLLSSKITPSQIHRFFGALLSQNTSWSKDQKNNKRMETSLARLVSSCEPQNQSAYLQELFVAVMNDDRRENKEGSMNFERGFNFLRFIFLSSAQDNTPHIPPLAIKIANNLCEKDTLEVWMSNMVQSAFEVGSESSGSSTAWKMLNTFLDHATDDLKNQALREFQKSLSGTSPQLAAIWTKNTLQAALLQTDQDKSDAADPSAPKPRKM